MRLFTQVRRNLLASTNYLPTGLRLPSSKVIRKAADLYDQIRVSAPAARELVRKVTLRPVTATGALKAQSNVMLYYHRRITDINKGNHAPRMFRTGAWRSLRHIRKNEGSSQT